jgi:ferritin heavy chain
MSFIQVNFSAESEKALNSQFNLEYYASYVYLSIANYASRADIALPGLETYARKMSIEERDHAIKFMDYIVMRGGKLNFEIIRAPPSEWRTPLDVFEGILELEMTVYKSLLALHQVASESNDPQLTDFIEGEFLNDQVKDIKKVGDLLTRLKRAGTEGLGLVYWDHELLQE